MNNKYITVLMVGCLGFSQHVLGMIFLRQCVHSVTSFLTSVGDKISSTVSSQPIMRSVLPWINGNKFYTACIVGAATVIALRYYMKVHGCRHLVNAVRAKEYLKAYVLADCGAYLSTEVKDELSPDLQRALRADDRDYAKLLIECDVELNEEQEELLSQDLLDAFNADNLERAQFLIDAGIQISREPSLLNNARTQLACALRTVADAPINSSSATLNWQKAKLLMLAQVKFNAAYGLLARPLDYILHSATFEGRKEFVEFLLLAGISVDRVNRTGRTALHVAASCGYVGIMDLLLERHAQTDLLDNSGKTPLSLADTCSQVHAGALLVRRGADLSLAGTLENDHLRRFALDFRENIINSREII